MTNMKELSIEQKAKRYDESIERAKKWRNAPNVDKIPTFANRVIEELFPELKESEDERIKKEIITHCRNIRCVTEEGAERISKWIAWLEKQDSKKSIDELTQQEAMDIAVAKCFEQSDDKKEINNFDVIPGLYKCVHRMFDETPDGRLLFEVDNVYKCLSKHDRAEFEVSYGHSIYLEDPVVRKHFIPFEKQDKQKTAWSEEDEKFFKTALWHISYSISNGKSTDIHCDTTDWLKTLKQRCTWKPSDEQMKALRDLNLTGNISYAGQGQRLIELYNDLKKLKGE